MNKEPIGLYIFRFILGFGLFAFMCMLYWSSTLIEQEVRDLRADITQVKNDLFSLRSDVDKVRSDVLEAIIEEQDDWQEVIRSLSYEEKQTALASKPQEVFSDRPHIDPNLPNLLENDLFFGETLPEMLGKGFKPKGTLKGAVIGKPAHLHPFSNWNQVNTWLSQCSVTVARLKFGKYETFSPNMAIKVEERLPEGSKVPEFWVHLREGVYWQPLRQNFFSEGVELSPHFLRKHQVTAHDFKFHFDAMMNPFVQEAGAVAMRNYFEDVEQIEVIDNLTFVVRWRPIAVADGGLKRKYVAKQLTGQLRPLPSFVYKYFADGTKIVEDDTAPETYRTNSVWAQNFVEHWAKNIIVSCGPWVFDGMTDRQIKFKRNRDHYFPLDVLVERQEVDFKNTPDAVWQAFKANKLDNYGISPDQLIELENFLDSDLYLAQQKKGDEVKRLDYLGRSYSYIGWNQAKPYFKSKKVRQAMTMAIDRARIISQNLNNHGVLITGPFFRYSPSYDRSIEPWPFDIQEAKRLLEEDGWYDSDGDGIIDKLIDGERVPFRFSLTYYVKNPTTKAICEYVSTALKEVGVQCMLNGVDLADLSSSFDDKSFDALLLGWALGTPPEDPRQLWHSDGAKERGSSNGVGFANQEADAIIDQLQYEDDPAKRLDLYHRFHAIIYEEQPYTFLYSPKTVLLYRSYLQNVFLPIDRQDLVPGANMAQPQSQIFWIKQ